MKDLLIPDEWQSLPALLRQILGIVGKTSHAYLKMLVGFALPFAAGSALGLYAIPMTPSTSEALIRGVLSFAGLLSGFMVTLMLFTGRTEKTDSLSLEAAREYRDKVIYLLWSQTQTLVFSLTTALMSVLWMLAESRSNSLMLEILTVGLFGFLAVALVRTVLLPLQIFDLHQFALNMMVSEKADALRKTIAEQKDED